jgi:hypothetical protein
MSKITKATFKSFIKKNAEKLYCKRMSVFDGRVDTIMPIEEDFERPDRNKWAIACEKNTLGIRQIWLVGFSRDYFKPYEDDQYIGIEWSNVCGNGVVAIRKDQGGK